MDWQRDPRISGPYSPVSGYTTPREDIELVRSPQPQNPLSPKAYKEYSKSPAVYQIIQESVLKVLQLLISRVNGRMETISRHLSFLDGISIGWHLRQSSWLLSLLMAHSFSEYQRLSPRMFLAKRL